MIAKAYRLMKAIMSTAVDEGIVERNPCRVRGAGQDRSPERPVLSVGEVVALVEVMPERYRALVLLVAFGSLRWGELAALRRRDVDVVHGTVRVERSLTELSGCYLFGPPKSAAGKRMVVVPAVIRPALADHLATFTASLPDALVFTSPNGAPCVMATSGAGCGVPRWPRRACPQRIFTIFATPATRSRR